MLVQWVSCGSVELRPGHTGSRIRAPLITDAGWNLLLIERSASGDSRGPACHELDYETELAHYLEAYLKIKDHPLIDQDKLVLNGSSLGSTMAPLLAEKLLENDIKVAGVMIQGGGGISHFERMLNFERLYLQRTGEKDKPRFSIAEVQPELYDRTLFLTEYLIKGRHPDDIAKDSETMATVRQSIRGLDDRTQYGRPYSWHQQAAQANFLKAWYNIDASVLVVYTEFDQFEMRHGHQMIVELVNRWRPGTATFVELPELGHSSYRYADAIDAYINIDGEPDPEPLAAAFSDWLKNIE